MSRTSRLFVVTLVCATTMLATGWSIRPGIDGASVMLGMVRFVLLMAGGAAAVAVWATALIAAMHHVIWPLFLAMAVLVVSALACVLS